MKNVLQGRQCVDQREPVLCPAGMTENSPKVFSGTRKHDISTGISESIPTRYLEPETKDGH